MNADLNSSAPPQGTTAPPQGTTAPPQGTTAPPQGVPRFPTRPDDAHKGSVGRIVVIGGRFDELGMVGAPALAANAAFRTGAGLVQILTAPEAQLPVSLMAPCATTRILADGDEKHLAALAADFDADVVAIGPGLSPMVGSDDLSAILGAFDGGLVIDADGLNALSKAQDWRARPSQQLVVTPHPGEMRQLLAGLGIEADVQQRAACAQALAERTGAVVVLKGAGTVVTDAKRTYINQTGHSGMATGGAGDVLTGVVAALMGQKMSGFDAAVLAVYLHGRAGELAGRRIGNVSVTAADIGVAIPEAIQLHLEQGET